jgi:hypothetical protein
MLLLRFSRNPLGCGLLNGYSGDASAEGHLSQVYGCLNLLLCSLGYTSAEGF